MGTHLCVVSLNVQRQLGSQSSFDAAMCEIQTKYPHWAGACFIESDGHYNHEFVIGENSSHTIQRHWPGAGSVAMTVVIRDRWAKFVRDLHFEGRVCTVHWKFSGARHFTYNLLAWSA